MSQVAPLFREVRGHGELQKSSGEDFSVLLEDTSELICVQDGLCTSLAFEYAFSWESSVDKEGRALTEYSLFKLETNHTLQC